MISLSSVDSLCQTIVILLSSVDSLYLIVFVLLSLVDSLCLIIAVIYGNALLLGINQIDLNKLQRLQNWAAKLIFCAKKQDHATPFMKELHWLPIKDRIHFKILLFKCLNNNGPSYFASMLSLYTSARIGLRSSKDSTRLQEHKMYPRTLISAADRSFHCTSLQYSPSCTPFIWFCDCV